jgi:putative ribosome biogenesis GTPase RsgA
VADTPGFNQPTLDNVTADALAATFPEIEMLLQERGR